jgi:hypothetical protein
MNVVPQGKPLNEFTDDELKSAKLQQFETREVLRRNLQMVETDLMNITNLQRQRAQEAQKKAAE